MPQTQHHVPTAITRLGFSYIEILIASAISVGLFLIITNILINGINNRQQAAASLTMQKTASRILNDITNQVHWAKKNGIGIEINRLNITDTNENTYIYQKNNQQMEKIFIPNAGGNPTTTVLTPEEIKVNEFTIELQPNETTPNRVNISLQLQHSRLKNITYQTSQSVSIRISQINGT